MGETQAKIIGTGVVGGMESIDSSGTVHGWTLDTTQPTAQLQVQLYLDGDQGVGALYTTVANQPRTDVNQKTGYPGDHGFTLKFPVADAQPHFVYGYASSTGAPVKLPMTYVAPCTPVCGPNYVDCGAPNGCGGTCACPVCPFGYHWCDPGCYKICP